MGMVGQDRPAPFGLADFGLGQKIGHKVNQYENYHKLDESEVQPLQVDSRF